MNSSSLKPLQMMGIRSDSPSVERQDREQLGLGAGLEAEVEFAAEPAISSQTCRCWFTLIG